MVVAQFFTVLLRSSATRSVNFQDKAYASQKAVEMLEELRGKVLAEGSQVNALDDYADEWDKSSGKPLYQFTLSTLRAVTHDLSDPNSPRLPDYVTAATPASANPQGPKGFKYVRHVEVQKDPRDSAIRRVYVRVYYAGPNKGSAFSSPALAYPDRAVPLAEVFAVLNSQGVQAYPAQVMDVFLVCIENVPGWWTRTSLLRPLMDASLINLQARNRGLVIRPHWIRALSYGRDMEYAPELNRNALATTNNIFKGVYVYPGLINFTDGDDFYYDPDWMDGRVREDGAILSSRSNYPLADQYNHAMRYPDEERMYAIRKLIASNLGQTTPEPSLRMLLEKMNQGDPAYRNAIVVNLHGEMVPIPPLRAVSNPAKNPAAYPGKAYRAVLHPEKMHYSTLTGTAYPVENPVMRLYAYQATTVSSSEADLIDVITVFVPGAKLNQLQQVDRMQGSSTVEYKWLTRSAATLNSASGLSFDGATAASSQFVADEYSTPQGRLGLRMRFYSVSSTARSYNTTGVGAFYQGLDQRRRPYNMEYCPFPVITAGSNSVGDLATKYGTSANNQVIKNTSRWRIEFKQTLRQIGNPVALEARLGVAGIDCTSGYLNLTDYSSEGSFSPPNMPANLSTSYVWLDQAPPITEQMDPLGDPRMIPYADFLGHTAISPTPRYANRYNWFFKDTAQSAPKDYYPELNPFIPKARFGPNSGVAGGQTEFNVDVPRLYGLWREGILADRSVYNGMTGWSAYYFGLGGEIGGDANNKLSWSGQDGVKIYGGPWNAAATSIVTEDIINPNMLVKELNNKWRSIPFLGELWDDAVYTTQWATTGNLFNTKAGGGKYHRDTWANCDDPNVYTFDNVRHRGNPAGGWNNMTCGSFLNGTSGSNSYNHTSVNFNGGLLNDGNQMGLDYHFPMPLAFTSSRPLSLDNVNNQPEWGDADYSSRRLALSHYTANPSLSANQKGIYDRPSQAAWRASSMVRGVLASRQQAGYFIISGIAPSGDSGANFVTRFAILSCLRAFHEAGVPKTYSGPQGSFSNSMNDVASVSYRIEPVPLVEITKPSLSDELRGLSVIRVEWKDRNVRWDGKRYSENYPCVDDFDGACVAQIATSPGNPDNEWHGSEPLAFTLIYSTDEGKTWRSAQRDVLVTPGVYESIDKILATAHRGQYDWDVSSLGVGKKLLRVQAFRENLPLHYAYHEYPLQTNP